MSFFIYRGQTLEPEHLVLTAFMCSLLENKEHRTVVEYVKLSDLEYEYVNMFNSVVIPKIAL